MYNTEGRHVHLAACADYEYERVEKAVKDCFEAFDFLPCVKNKRVLLKVNLLLALGPDRAATTHPSVVRAAAGLCLEAGAVSVTIADSPGGPFNRSALENVYRATSMTAAAEQSGAILNFNTDTVTKNGMTLTAYLDDADVVIDIAKLKTHSYARMTAAVKNLYGCIPGLNKAAYHAKKNERGEFSRFVCDICDTVRPDFTLIDGIVGMEGKGPSGGTPKKAGVIIASDNPHCADLAGSDIMCMGVGRIPILKEGIRRGYAPESVNALELSGSDIASLRTQFVPPPYMEKSGIIAVVPGPLRRLTNRFLEPYPVISERYVGCGKCAESCPQHIIKIENKRAHIDYKSCQKCYCCQEMCIPKAIDLRRKLKVPKS
ncbi:MAG: DUF362 domain-containing protein [Clostridia bacterium]|nr:DUF362 domain-containing protein [Clostridia bacterium]